MNNHEKEEFMDRLMEENEAYHEKVASLEDALVDTRQQLAEARRQAAELACVNVKYRECLESGQIITFEGIQNRVINSEEIDDLLAIAPSQYLKSQLGPLFDEWLIKAEENQNCWSETGDMFAEGYASGLRNAHDRLKALMGDDVE